MNRKILLSILLLSYNFLNAQIFLPSFTLGTGSGAALGQFENPYGVKISADNRMYVADAANHRISVWTLSGSNFVPLTTFGGLGSGIGQLNSPAGIDIVNNNLIYVADQLNNRITVWSCIGINYTHYASFGSQGSASNQLRVPSDVAVSPTGKIYIADANNNRVSVWTNTGSNFSVLTTLGTFGTGPRQFYTPVAISVITVSSFGIKDRFFAADLDRDNVKVWEESNGNYTDVTVFGGFPANIDGATGVYANQKGQVFVSDLYNHRIYLFTASGANTYAPAQQFGSQGSGVGQFEDPRGLFETNDGKIYVADYVNNRISVWNQCYSPTLVTSPQSYTTCGNTFVSISISATGTNLKYSWSNGATTSGFNTSIAGVYYVTVSGECGNPIIDSAVYTIPNCFFDFDGTNDYIEIPYSPALNPTDEFTIMAWANVKSGYGDYRSLVTSRDMNGGFVIYIAPNDEWQFWVVDGTSPWAELHSGYFPQYGAWTHIAVTYKNGAMKFYINGAMVASATAGAYINNKDRPMRIAAGATEGAADYIFPGEIDDFAYFNKALPESYIQDNYTKQLRGDEKSLLLYYDFQQGIPSGDNTSIDIAMNKANTTFTGTFYNTDQSGGSVSNFDIKDFSVQSISTCTPVFISGNTMASTLCGFTPQTLSVTNSGINLSYLWSNGATTPAISTSISGTYTLSIDGGCMKAVSNPINILFRPLTQIVTQPANQSYCLGTTAGITISAVGTNLNYLWSNGSTLSGINTSIVGIYDVTVSGTCGVVKSVPASVSTLSGTSINLQPQSQTICGGNLSTISVSVTGDNVSYKWNTGESSSFIIKSISGIYLVSVAGTCGSVISDQAILLVNPKTEITTQPISKVFCEGESVVLSASATGTGAISYLWSNGSSTTSISTSVAGVFVVTASGTCGDAISNAATVESGIATQIVNQPISSTVCSGLVVNFNVSAIGSNLVYEWNSGQNTPSISTSLSGTYLATVSGDCGVAVSNTATNAYIKNTELVTPIQNQTITAGNLANLSVSATGESLTYRWNTGETTNVIQEKGAGTYTATISGTCGVITASGTITELSNLVTVTSIAINGSILNTQIEKTITISGKNFGQNILVSINGLALGTVSILNDSTLTALLPAGAVTSTPLTVLVQNLGFMPVFIENPILIEVIIAANVSPTATSVHIYPNPSKGEIVVSGITIDDKLSIYDMYGKIVLKIENTPKNEIKLDLSHYPKGIYMIKINNTFIKQVLE